MDQKSPDYALEMCESAPESQPLTKHMFSDGSETDVDDFESLRTTHDRHSSRTIQRKHIILIVLLAIVSHLASGCVGFYYNKGPNLDAACSSYTTQYSPLLEEVGIKYDFIQYNGSFLEETIYRQRGSPEVDDAWEALGVNSRAGVITREQGLKSGLTNAHVQRADKYGGGFFVNVEGMHHLHCLNLVRQGLYWNYEYYKELGAGAFVNDDMIIEKHISHCLDTIRQTLMCNADTGVLGQVWFDHESPTAFPDFNTRHKCKNFDDISRWAVEHQELVPDALPDDYMKEPKPEYVGENTP
ncbi:hypothetical protein J7T55_001374 [Diaporthe amygdali]|uniref:uncharacterized protein n=1 Tax=Phomopsis amygdali TaxID=1214568 RepID=UPI0022FE2E5F|nr:uncharacterized protein J7T55_001374 [Diaporthe amygdali]KAJ0103755.1 hypothetical protein J7T55_001374 [Diaporthe amygdali]